MYARLVIAVLFVAAVTQDTTTMAQTPTTAAPSSTTTTAASSTTTTAASSTTTTAASSTTTTAASSTTTTAAPSSTTTTAAPSSTTTTAAPSSTTTTAAPSSTTTTAAPSSTTTTAASSTTTTAASNTTGTAASNTTGTAASNTTGTAASNTTGTAASNTTTTGASNTTGTTASTNIPVGSLNTTISRAGCGTQEFCAAQPSSCDPSTAGSCYFLSAQLLSGLNYLFGLSGISPGYIALTLSPDNIIGNNDTTYICANNNGTVQFFTASLNTNSITVTNVSVSSVKGSVSGNKIQCTFNAIAPTAAARALSMTLEIFTGSYNATSETFGTVTSQLKVTVSDLSNPGGSVNNHGITFRQPVTQALLILVGVLGLAVQ